MAQVVRKRQAHKVDYWQIMAAMVLTSLLFSIWTAPFWTIQSIEIKGTSPYTRKYIEQFLQTQTFIGKHILKLNPLIMKQKILKNPLIRSIQFERELLPTRLTIKVQERQAAHFIYPENRGYPLLDKKKAWIIDYEGMVLPLPVDALPEQSVQVCIQAAQIKTKLPQAQLDLLRELDALVQQKVIKATGIFDLSNSQNLILHLQEPAVKVWLGQNTDLFMKLKLLTPTLETAKKQDASFQSVEYIDLRFWKNPVIKTR